MKIPKKPRQPPQQPQPEQFCKTCFCTETMPCPDQCSWAEPGLCTGCAEAQGDKDKLRDRAAMLVAHADAYVQLALQWQGAAGRILTMAEHVDDKKVLRIGD